jgi:hypothetical protein
VYRTVVGTIYKIKREETRPCSQPLNQPQMEVNAVLKTVVGSLEALRATPPSDHAHAHVHVHVHTYVCMCALVADTSNRLTSRLHPHYTQLLTPSVPRPGHAVSCRPP